MGQSKGGGYEKLPTLAPNQMSSIDQILNMALGNQQQAAQGFSQFLPGGGGGKPIIEAAEKNFQQRTIPSILNAYGTDNKGSSALNQALAAGAADLNTNLGSILSELQLRAAEGIGGMGTNQAQVGMTPKFAYAPRQNTFLENLILGLTGASGQVGQGWASTGFKKPWG